MATVCLACFLITCSVCLANSSAVLSSHLGSDFIMTEKVIYAVLPHYGKKKKLRNLVSFKT